jgi:hypothetical protein
LPVDRAGFSAANLHRHYSLADTSRQCPFLGGAYPVSNRYVPDRQYSSVSTCKGTSEPPLSW